jgi:hypothetical protein
MRFATAVVFHLIPAMIALFSVTLVAQIPSGREVPVETKAKTVVDMTPAELLRFYHKELSDLEFSPSQDELSNLLEKMGERVSAFFRDFANTSAKEHVVMQMSCRTGLFNQRESNFLYLIMPRSTLTGIFFSEYRTDKKNRPVDRTAELGSFMLSSGYAGLCLYLDPSHQANSRFRYLGRETGQPRPHVLAFAQEPESEDYLAQYCELGSSKSIRYLVQGFVWVMPGAELSMSPTLANVKAQQNDTDSCQILRMRTSMQSPGKDFLKEQITDIRYQRVRFDSTGQQLWLPREVDVRWELPDWTYRNRHRYSDYQLFGIETDYSIGQPKID